MNVSGPRAPSVQLIFVFGAIVVVAGVSLILNAFHIPLPLFRLALGVVLGWFGLSLLLSALGVQKPWLAFSSLRAVTSSSTLALSPSLPREGVLFSSKDIDLTHLRPGEQLRLGVFFGDLTLLYDPRLPVEVRTSTAFGSTAYADGSSLAFGERMVRGAGDLGITPAVVDVATVFGTTRLVVVSP